MAMQPHQIDRASLWLLGVIGVVVVIGGIFQIRGHLFATERNVLEPFREQLAQARAEGRFLTNAADQDEQELLEKQQSDTDEDGLSDFDEEFIHGTSPYLADTDSDGTNDYEEIIAASNPLCASGDECIVERTEGSGTTPEAVDAFASLAPSFAGAETVTTEQVAQQYTPDELRQLLRDAGVAEDVIAGTDDETLLELAAQSAAESQQPAGTDAIANVYAQADAIRALSTDEKRQFLVQSGLQSSELDQLSDEQIEQLVDQALEEAVTSLTTDPTQLQSAIDETGGLDGDPNTPDQ